MDAASLIAGTTLECAGWLTPAAADCTGSGASIARATQDRLIAVVRSAMRLRIAEQSIRELLFDAINATSKMVIADVPGTIDEVEKSGASYLMVFEAIDETIREVYSFQELPFIQEAKLSFSWMARLRDLPQRQQALVMQLLELELDLRHATVHSQFAQEDGDEQEKEKLAAEMGKLSIQLARALARLSPDALAAKNGVQKLMSPMEIHRCPPVIEAEATARAADLLSVAASMDRAGDSLIQSLPITNDTRLSSRRNAASGWVRLGDLGNTLHVLAIWLRALASDGGARRCVLCYRHIGYGGKIFCAEHQRQGGKRQPARVFHIAHLYPEEVEHLSKTEPDLKAAIANAALVKDERFQVTAAPLPEGITIPEPLIQSASTLIAALRRASPAMGPELGGLVEHVWRELVRIAADPYVITRQASKDDVTLRRVRQEQARRWLTWNTFFKAWWAKSYEGPGASQQILTGHAYDIDHPISHGYVVPPGGVVIDLLRQRAWTRAEQRVETEAYVNVQALGRLIAEGKSLRTIAELLGVSHETVRQTLRYSQGLGLPSDKRLRALPSFKSNRGRGRDSPTA